LNDGAIIELSGAEDTDCGIGVGATRKQSSGGGGVRGGRGGEGVEGVLNEGNDNRDTNQRSA